MKRAFEELLNDRIDNTSVELCSDINFAKSKERAEELFELIDEKLPEDSKHLIDDLYTLLVDILASSEEFSYKNGYSDATIVLFESLNLGANTGQKPDKQLKS